MSDHLLHGIKRSLEAVAAERGYFDATDLVVEKDVMSGRLAIYVVSNDGARRAAKNRFHSLADLNSIADELFPPRVAPEATTDNRFLFWLGAAA